MTWSFLALALLLSFLLSGLESGILSVSLVRLRHHAKEGHKAALRLEKMISHRDRLLSAILLLNNTLNFFVFAITAKKLVSLLGGWGYLAAIAISLPVYLFFLELLPKSLFKRFPFRILKIFVPLLQLIHYTLGPFMGLGIMVSRLFRQKSDNEPSRREEFRSLTALVEREGSLSSQERRMIEGVLDFHNVTAGQIMIPMSQVTALPLDMPVSAALELSRETGLNQFPVISPQGELVGLFNAFEALLNKQLQGNVVHFLHRLVRTHPREKAPTIMRRLRRGGIQLAAVYSPRGRPLGIVRSQDLVNRALSRF